MVHVAAAMLQVHTSYLSQGAFQQKALLQSPRSCKKVLPLNALFLEATHKRVPPFQESVVAWPKSKRQDFTS